MSLEVLDPIGRPEKSKAIQYAVAGPVVRAINDVCARRRGSWFHRRSLHSEPADPHQHGGGAACVM